MSSDQEWRLQREITLVTRWVLQREALSRTAPIQDRYRTLSLLDATEHHHFMASDWHERQRVVEQICRRRAAVLAQTNSGMAPNSQDEALSREGQGKLLAFDPSASLSDGAASVATEGFFDFDNTPPWDLWLAYETTTTPYLSSWRPFSTYLICWIPDALVELVSAGCDVNPEGCLKWLS